MNSYIGPPRTDGIGVASTAQVFSQGRSTVDTTNEAIAGHTPQNITVSQSPTIIPQSIAGVSFELLADSVSYKGMPKPDNREMACIRMRLMQPEARVSVSIDQLDGMIRNGYTLLPGICIGGTRLCHWTGQQLFFLDFDNDKAMKARGYDVLDPVDALDRAYEKKLDPLFLYFSAKATVNPWNPRYRIVFAFPSIIADRNKAEKIGAALLRIFPEADPSSCQLNRMFLCPGKEVWPCWNLTS